MGFKQALFKGYKEITKDLSTSKDRPPGPICRAQRWMRDWRGLQLN